MTKNKMEKHFHTESWIGVNENSQGQAAVECIGGRLSQSGEITN